MFTQIHLCFFTILMQRKLQRTISATCNLISLAHNIFSNVFNIAFNMIREIPVYLKTDLRILFKNFHIESHQHGLNTKGITSTSMLQISKYSSYYL